MVYMKYIVISKTKILVVLCLYPNHIFSTTIQVCSFCGIQTNVTSPLDPDITPLHGHISLLIFYSRPFDQVCQPYLAVCHEAGCV